MKITYDKQADAMYLRLSKGSVKKTIPVNPRVIVDVGERGKIIGVELLFVSERMPKTALRSQTLSVPMHAA